MALRVFIVDDLDRLSDGERAVLEEITAARYEAWLEERAKYMHMRPSQNAITAARLAQDSGAAANSAGNMVDAGQTTGPANPALTQIPADAARRGRATLPPNQSPNAGSGYEKQRDSRERPALFSDPAQADDSRRTSTIPAIEGLCSSREADEEAELGAEQQHAAVAVFDPTCADCIVARDDGMSRNGACATHRRACEACGRDDVPLHGDLVGEKGLPELWCDHCDPPPAVGLKYADPEQDPWDLASEELTLTRPLPREEPRYWGRDRGEFDPLDDKIDLQPFGRTTK